MRLPVAALVLFCASIAHATVVIHPAPSDPNQPAIVATDDANSTCVLDRFGQAWVAQRGVPWVRIEHFDPPVPLAELLFWTRGVVITTAGELFENNGQGDWFSAGFPPSVSGLAESARPSIDLLTTPNPSEGEARLDFTLPEAGRVSVRLFDASGRLVRELLEGDLPAGAASLRWDGRDDRGDLLPAGVYFSRVELAGGNIAGRIVRR